MAHRKVTVTREETHLEYTCDQCGNPATGRRWCCKCRRDLCNSCGIDKWEGDCDTISCRACWDIGAEYRVLRKVFAVKEDAAEESWTQACLAARKMEESKIKKEGE